MEEKPIVFKLEKYPTKDIKDSHVNGSLTVIWRPNDNEMQDVTFANYDWSKWE